MTFLTSFLSAFGFVLGAGLALLAVALLANLLDKS